jgi:hypothetical protein
MSIQNVVPFGHEMADKAEKHPDSMPTTPKGLDALWASWQAVRKSVAPSTRRMRHGSLDAFDRMGLTTEGSSKSRPPDEKPLGHVVLRFERSRSTEIP